MKTVIINAVISIVVVLLAVFSVLSHIKGTYATKDELVPFAEKEGSLILTERALEPYARKEQLKGLALDTNIAETREDLNEVINAFSQVKGELADLKALEEEMAVLKKAQGALAGKFERLPGAETYQPPVGAVIASLFSEKQFQSQYGEGWVAATGAPWKGVGMRNSPGRQTFRIYVESFFGARTTTAQKTAGIRTVTSQWARFKPTCSSNIPTVSIEVRAERDRCRP